MQFLTTNVRHRQAAARSSFLCGTRVDRNCGASGGSLRDEIRCLTPSDENVCYGLSQSSWYHVISQ